MAAGLRLLTEWSRPVIKQEHHRAKEDPRLGSHRDRLSYFMLSPCLQNSLSLISHIFVLALPSSMQPGYCHSANADRILPHHHASCEDGQIRAYGYTNEQTDAALNLLSHIMQHFLQYQACKAAFPQCTEQGRVIRYCHIFCSNPSVPRQKLGISPP